MATRPLALQQHCCIVKTPRDNGWRTDGWVAQLAEQWTENPRVGGSIPPPAIHPNEVRLERGGRGMVRTLGQLCSAMDRHNFSADSRVSAGRHDFGNRVGV